MKRNLSFEEISDGKKYTGDDLVKVSCNDCKGCSECCKVTEDTILLDPWDVYALSQGLSLTFEEMIGKYVDFTLIDNVPTPFLMKAKDTLACNLLSKEGRCLIHDYRPGFCRLFPLGRIYEEDGTFKYFIQVHECPYPNKTKIKVKQWLGIDNLKAYEEYIVKWHEVVKNISESIEENPDWAKAAYTKFINTFFITPYNTVSDFYSQFYKRLKDFSEI